VRTSKLIPRSAVALSENAISLRNPLSEDHVALRPTLFAGLLEVLNRNVRASVERVAIFELGRIFIPPTGKEERRLGLLLWGNATSAPHWWLREKHRLDFFELKAAIESLMIPVLSFQPSEHPDLALATEVLSGNRSIGFAGQLSAARTSTIDAPDAIFVAELHVDLVLSALGLPKTFHDIDRFPAVTRDIAMFVPEELSHAKILRVIENPQEPLLERVHLFDERRKGVGFPPGQKSLAYRLTYRERSRTLTSEEVTAVHDRIKERLKRELGVELRE